MPGLQPKIEYNQDVWHYLERWQKIFHRRRALRWRDGWLQNGYCRLCRYCCGPQASNEPFAMALLPEQMPEGYEENFFLLNPTTAYLDARGCKADSPRGCRLDRKLRPVSCGLFPFVFNEKELYMYKICPAVLLSPLNQLFTLGKQAAQWLARLTANDREHIALHLPADVLAKHYVALNICIC